MELYSRYTDDKNRLIVVVSRRGTPVREGESYTLVDRKVELLNVHGEKTITITAEDFDARVRDGRLKRIT